MSIKAPKNRFKEGTKTLYWVRGKQWEDVDGNVYVLQTKPTALNTVLAVSGQPKFSIEEVIESIKTLWIKDFGRLDSNSPDRDGYFVCGFVREALMAACASGAVDKTVSEGDRPQSLFEGLMDADLGRE
ncbi:MAG TPA: hypothetical protein VFU05_00405 [Cyclobacteriaceae bacterium]|nr:hypothetical protein [Cyclobacteriaceae bacterium]